MATDRREPGTFRQVNAGFAAEEAVPQRNCPRAQSAFTSSVEVRGPRLLVEKVVQSRGVRRP